jgi:hypothetical protein
MSDPAQHAESTHLDAGEQADVDAVLAEFAGDHRAAIAALLYDLEALARDAEVSTSWGYVRGKVAGSIKSYRGNRAMDAARELTGGRS